MSAYSDLVTGHANLVLYYRLGESSGTTATDASSSGLNGTIAGSGITYGVAGPLTNDADTALTFDGTSDPITRTHDNALDVGDVFSLEFWVKRSATQGVVQTLITKATNQYEVRFTTGNRIALLKNGTAGNIMQSSVITDQNWHHVVVTKNGSTRNIYVDGAVDNAITGTNQTMVDNAASILIGHANGVQRFPGSMDELAVYNAALSADEVLQHYRTGLGAISLSETITLSDTQVKEPGLALSDSLTSSDSTANAPDVAKSDSITLTDAQALDAGLSLSDTASLSDAMSAAEELVLGDSVTLSDQFDSDLAEVLTKDLADSVTLADDLSTQLSAPTTEGGWVRTPRKKRHTLYFEDFIYLTDEGTIEADMDPDLRLEEELLLALL